MQAQCNCIGPPAQSSSKSAPRTLHSFHPTKPDPTRPPTKTQPPIPTNSGAAQAGAIAFGLFIFTAKVEGSINSHALPDAYTARNIAITVRTIIVGLLYLVTFIFSANTVGLTGAGGGGLGALLWVLCSPCAVCPFISAGLIQPTVNKTQPQTKPKPNPNQTQTKPKPNPNQTQTKPNPNQTQTQTKPTPHPQASPSRWCLPPTP